MHNKKDSQFVELLNFVSLKSDRQKSAILVNTLFAMLNQNIDYETKNQIIDNLQTLCKKIC